MREREREKEGMDRKMEAKRDGESRKGSEGFRMFVREERKM